MPSAPSSLNDRTPALGRAFARASLLLGTALAVVPCVASAAPAPTPPTVEQRYALADAYLGARIRDLVVDENLDARFIANDSGILFRRGRAGQREILYLDLATHQPRVIITETALAQLFTAVTGRSGPPGELPMGEPDYDATTGALTFGALGKRWTLKDGALAEAATGAPKGDDAVSPDGRFRIIAEQHNLAVLELKTGRKLALTTDGTRDMPYGRGIAELSEILRQGTEDPVLPVSVRWSPDSKRILTWRLDTTDVKRLTMTQETPPGAFYPRSFSYVYPLAGAARLPQAKQLVIDIEDALARGTATIVPLQVPSESLLYPADPYIGWSAGKVRSQWTERGYGQLVVYMSDPVTGASSVVAREAMKPLVTVTSSFLQPAPELGGELDVSERTGWAQLYLVRPDAPDGGIALTKGQWEVTAVNHVDGEHRSILLTGVGREADRNPYYHALYRVNLDGSAPHLLTPEPLNHELRVSDDGRFAIDAMSSPTVPTRTVVRDTSDGHIVFELGRTDASALVASGFTMPEPFRGVAADGKTPLYAMIYRPAHFDPTRRYPVIDNVYTGPTTHVVPSGFGEAVFNAPGSVAQLGAVVVVIDATGTSQRGQAFRLPAYQNLGEVGLDDHIAMIRQIAARYPYIDTTRAGVYGGSAGGYDAARFILRRPDFFKVAIASSGNHDLRLDKAWWPEVSMGNPDQAVWDRNSNMSVAGNLKGKLLLIHGEIDDNVPITESYRLGNALIQAQRSFDMVVLPNTTHRVPQPFFWRKFRDYFVRNLLDEAPPADAAFADQNPHPAAAPAAPRQ
ncbi:DPP IV N-terminal domain-containing protein [Sphingomonas sp. RB3P16]|uniref:S9 family peptidase n=1 Tax=Parasphingomonas frigoris TaxID=3096163 RepID=UPI002FC63E46